MSGNHVLRLFSAALANFRSQFSHEFVPRSQARYLKHRALRLEACEDRNVLAATAVISGVVFGDDNNDGAEQLTETGIAGVTLTLSGTNDLGPITPATAVTASDGSYSFANLRPGSYTVTETQPAGYFDGLDAKNNVVIPLSDTTDAINGITLVDGQVASGNTFGEIPAVTISGTVFADANNDGIQQGTELGIANVDLSAMNGGLFGDVVATTATLSDGSYSFDHLRPGTYSILVNSVDGFVNGQSALN
ncbi:MAG: hypothetical protein HY288_08190, partial [Planctomycetia bacterium]|nr:hypothetical protein [Planctomycetia bacterium]